LLLDGFDEFPPLTSHNVDKIFTELFEEIRREFGTTFAKIVITARIEPLTHESKIQDAYISIDEGYRSSEYVKLNRLNKRQIIKTYKSSIILNSDDTSSNKRKITLQKLKEYMRKTHGISIFSNSFFVSCADDILSDLSEKQIDTLTNEIALDKIVEKGLEREKRRFDSEDYEIDVSNFEGSLLRILTKTAIVIASKIAGYKAIDAEIMDEADCVHNGEVAELFDYINTRALIVREGHSLKFIHRLLLEYFIARGIQAEDMPYSVSRKILSDNTSLGSENIKRFYAHLINKKNPQPLAYGIDELLANTLITNYVKLSDDALYDALMLLEAKDIFIANDAYISMDTLFRILPLLDEAVFTEYPSIEHYFENEDLVSLCIGVGNGQQFIDFAPKLLQPLYKNFRSIKIKFDFIIEGLSHKQIVELYKTIDTLLISDDGRIDFVNILSESLINKVERINSLSLEDALETIETLEIIYCIHSKYPGLGFESETLKIHLLFSLGSSYMPSAPFSRIESEEAKKIYAFSRSEYAVRKAVDFFEKVAEASTNNTNEHYKLGAYKRIRNLYFEMERYDEGIKFHKKIADIYENEVDTAWYIYTLAKYHCSNKDYLSAIKCYNQSIELDKFEKHINGEAFTSTLYRGRGISYFAIGNQEKANQDKITALELFPNCESFPY